MTDQPPRLWRNKASGLIYVALQYRLDSDDHIIDVTHKVEVTDDFQQIIREISDNMLGYGPHS